MAGVSISSRRCACTSTRPRLSDGLFFEQLYELTRLGDFQEPLRHVGLLAELRDLAQHRQILIRHLERGSDDQKKEVDRLFVDRLEVDAAFLSPKGDAQLVDDERPAVGNRDPASDARRPKILPTLEHLE